MATNFSEFYEVKPRRNIVPRFIELTLLVLHFFLLGYRIINLKERGFTWLLCLLCESWFTFDLILLINNKWNPIEYITYPHRILQMKNDLPQVDVFVTTADPELEPPILTINTMISLLAVDYPSDKLACYISDDSCSPLIYYSLTMAVEFAKLWVPFCIKYDVEVRAPFRYFLVDQASIMNLSPEFLEEWKTIKNEYIKLCRKIEDAAKNQTYLFNPDLHEEYVDFSNIDRTNHATIVKVIWENNGAIDHLNDFGLPPIVYVSREKHPNHSHNFKAGAMNVLTRVSSEMTNAPFILNLDCDQFVNNPKVILHAMCILLGDKQENTFAFVQFPQRFHDGNKDDPFGNQIETFARYIEPGIAGIQGPFYEGTGCIHRRKAIYGLSPHEKTILERHETLGDSKKLTKQVVDILNGKVHNAPWDLQSLLNSAIKVAECGYEHDTLWGRKVGWIYGSATEDSLTGLTILSRGWRSAFCDLNPPAFLGCAPPNGPAVMVQVKRWSTGLLQILLSKNNPLIFVFKGKLKFRQALSYIWAMIWGLRSFPEICYAVLPAYCIIANTNFLPKVGEHALFIPLAIFFIQNLYTLSEYLRVGLSIRAWWNNLRMGRVNIVTAPFFGLLSVILILLGLSETTFEVTKKEHLSNAHDKDSNSENARFSFDESPIYISGTTVLLIQLVALGIGTYRFGGLVTSNNGCGFGELICSLWVVTCYWVFLYGLFGKGKYGIPYTTIIKAGVLTIFFVGCFWVT